MHKGFIKTGALLLALAVILGAFGAHGLKSLLTDKELVSFDTGVRYQFYHAFGLLATGILYKEFTNRYVQWAGRLFVYGILVFCGSLYLITIMKLQGLQGFGLLGAITPVGGLFFVAGWILLWLAVVKKS